MTLDVSNPVFIIGGSRTGSEMIKTVLSLSDELDLLNELFLFCPRWLHKDLRRTIKEYVGELNSETDRAKIVELMFSGNPHGWMFSDPDRNLDKEVLEEELKCEPLSIRSIFLALMKTHARKNGKRRIGAKFPLHYSYAEKLFDWFPNCTVIHTVRDPRAIYASQARKHIHSSWPWWRRQSSQVLQFVHICIQTYWTSWTHRRLVGDKRYRLVRYEDVIGAPEESIRALCEFVGIEFSPRMLFPGQYQSSFVEKSRGTGFDSAPLTIWKSKLSASTQRLIIMIAARPARHFGYRLSWNNSSTDNN